MNFSTTVIFGILASFFLLVAIIKGFLARAERRRAEDARSAALNGGTPDAPIHLDSPFSAPPEQEPKPNAEVPEEKKYVWE